MDSATSIGLIGLCAGAGAVLWAGVSVILTHRRIERSRPPMSSDWSVSVWGDVPQVPDEMFHNGTINR